MLLDALQHAIQSPELQLPTTIASLSLKTAKSLYAWSIDQTNKDIIMTHNDYLINFFKLWTSSTQTTQYIREEVWKRFATFVSSTEYRCFWKSLYSKAGTEECSVLSFELTFTMFTTYWKTTIKEKEVTTTTQLDVQLTFDEQNALWYIGGYLIHSVRKQINKVKCQEKENLLDLLDSLQQDNEADEDVDLEELCSQNWVKAINRGHLIRCTNDFHTFLYTVEMLIKRSFSFGRKSLQEHLEEITNNDEIKKIWNGLFADGEEATENSTNLLLEKVLIIYITVRGFRYTSRFMEKYKISKKKNLDKSKSIRTKLQFINTFEKN